MKQNRSKLIIENGILKQWHLLSFKRISDNNDSNDEEKRLDIRLSSPIVIVGGLKDKVDSARFTQDIFYHPFSTIKSTLTSVKISDSVKVIGEKAFEHCPELTTILGGSNLETIRISAFLGCKSLEEVHLYPSLKSIHQWAFSHCPKLKRITFHGTIAQFKKINIDDDAISPDTMIHTTEGVMYQQAILRYKDIRKKINTYLKSVRNKQK
jgi:hypothetical protein